MASSGLRPSIASRSSSSASTTLTGQDVGAGLDFEHRIGRFKEYLPIMTALLGGFAEAGVNHFMVAVQASAQWPNYWDAAELLAREVVPKVRSA
jgi:hypothetical protein